MPELTLHNIDQISREISRQEITFSHLLEDLIDHVCCDVEYEMQSAGLDFNAAYRKVKQKMGSRRLKEIQEETLYAVDSKYRKMKNTMKIAGIAGTILLGFAALFKIQHWPLAGVMLTLGAVTLALVFMPSALVVLWKESHSTKRLFLFISAFLAGMFFIMGTLFKVQHWPVAGLLLLLSVFFGLVCFVPAFLVSKFQDEEKKYKRPAYIIMAAGMISYGAGMFFKLMHWPLSGLLMVLGLVTLCFIALPWYTWITWKKEEGVTSKYLFIITGALLIILPGTLINLNLQQTYEGGYYAHHAQQKALNDYISTANNTFIAQYRDSSCFTAMKDLDSRTAGIIAYIDGIESHLISRAEGKPGQPVMITDQIIKTETGQQIQLQNISNPFYEVSAEDLMLPDGRAGDVLSSMVKDYLAYASAESGISSFLPDPSLSALLDIPENRPVSMMSVLHSLELMKNSILALQSSAMKNIADRN